MSTYSNDSCGEIRSDDDGYDTPGSIADFIVDDEDELTGSMELSEDDDVEESGSDDESSEEEELDLGRETAELLNDFPFDRSLLQEDENVSSGLRRSRRTRTAPVRYVDENYSSMMLEDASDLSEGSDDIYNEETDSDFEAPVSQYEDDDEDETEEEESED